MTLEALISPLKTDGFLASIYINFMLAGPYYVFCILCCFLNILVHFPELLWSMYYHTYSESHCIGEHPYRGFIKSFWSLVNHLTLWSWWGRNGDVYKPNPKAGWMFSQPIQALFSSHLRCSCWKDVNITHVDSLTKRNGLFSFIYYNLSKADTWVFVDYRDVLLNLDHD